MFLMYAAIAFALSAAARWDWLSLVAVTVFANYVWLRYGASTSVLAKLLYLMPPLHRTSEIYEAVAKGAPVNASLLAWFTGYGLVSYLIGLVVLRYRRLAIV
jgi:heme exporter protein D